MRVFLGVFASLILIGSGVFILMAQVQMMQLYGLSPEGAGNFISGVFAPIALIWLIVGYFQQSEELRKNSDALRQQVEEMKSNGAALKQQSDLLMSQQKTLERRAFIEFLEPRRVALSMRAFNILRAFATRSEIKERMEWFGAGYIDIFSNWLYNVVREGDQEQTLIIIESFFSNGRQLCLDYCTDYEQLLNDADRHDTNEELRRNIEYSGAGSAYLGLAALLHRPVAFRHRSRETNELLATDNGWKTPTEPQPNRKGKSATNMRKPTRKS